MKARFDKQSRDQPVALCLLSPTKHDTLRTVFNFSTPQNPMQKIACLAIGIVLLFVGCSSAQEPPNHKGHFGAVFCAAFSPDGKKIVTAGYDNTARIWDIESGEELHVLKGHRGHSAGINSVAFSPDGKKIVTAGSDGTARPRNEDGIGNIRIWDVETGKELRKLEGYQWTCYSAAFSPDGKKVVATEQSADNKVVLIWDTDSGEVLQRLEGHSGFVAATAFFPDGKKIIATDGKTVRIWDTESGKELQRFAREPWDGIFSIAISPDGTKIVAAGYDKSTRIWDANLEKELQKFEGEYIRASSAIFSPDGTKIVTSGYDKST